MTTLETCFLIFLGIQILHSIEELTTGFNKRFPFFKLSFASFLIFEILFLSFWILVYSIESFPIRTELMAFYLLLMFANGIWHLAWWGIEKKYVPGLVTAPLFVIGFPFFYYQLF
ncbi:MAG: HXXEE domain-containing protein [Bacteroidia bacterium]|nr:HXXEE domain-containing protein [Bacteroidia bacterium]